VILIIDNNRVFKRVCNRFVPSEGHTHSNVLIAFRKRKAF